MSEWMTTCGHSATVAEFRSRSLIGPSASASSSAGMPSGASASAIAVHSTTSACSFATCSTSAARPVACFAISTYLLSSARKVSRRFVISFSLACMASTSGKAVPCSATIRSYSTLAAFAASRSRLPFATALCISLRAFSYSVSFAAASRSGAASWPTGSPCSFTYSA